jgi:PEP-CTERM motif
MMKFKLIAAALASAMAFTPAFATSVLVINGSGSSTIAAPITAAGFTVIGETFRPGAISDHLSVANDIAEIWVWNDGTFGNTFSPEQPLTAFNAADAAALITFNAAHSKWIMDGLSWRANGNVDEQNFTKNEALALFGAGGGIVLGADDSSGALIVQHVNQVAALFGFDLFGGIYNTDPSTQHFGGSLITTPFAVNPANVVGTATYSEVPNGLQGNGIFLSTVVFGRGIQNFCCGDPGPELGNATFDGILYDHVNHVVTTSIAGAGIDPIPGVPEPATWALMLAGFGIVGAAARRRANVRVSFV